MDEVARVLIDFWLFDIWVFTQWWLYAPLCIPAVAYLGFFFLKWTILTTPLWLPFAIIFKTMRQK